MRSFSPNQIEQGTTEWYRQRLGHISGSQVHKIMSVPRAKGETFTDTAKTYLYGVASELMLSEKVVDDDDMFWLYLDQVDITNKAMRFGTEQEPNARALYGKLSGDRVTQVGFIEHPDLDLFGASPDGVVPEKDYGIEIKCPMPATAARYYDQIHDGESLKRVKPEYYWQVMAEIENTGAAGWRFLVYCPFLAQPMHRVDINRNDADIQLMLERVDLGIEFCKSVSQKFIKQ